MDTATLEQELNQGDQMVSLELCTENLVGKKGVICHRWTAGRRNEQKESEEK